MLGGMPQPVAREAKAGRIPVVIGTYSYWNTVAQTNLAVAIPARAKRAGIRFLYQQTRPNDAPHDPMTGGERLGWIKRPGPATGNLTVALFSKVLDDTDVAAGQLIIPSTSASNGVVGLWLWNCATITGALVNSGNEVTTGFNRSPDLLQNAIASVSMTPSSGPALAINSLSRGGGTRTVNTPGSGWASIVATDSAAFVDAGRGMQRFAAKAVLKDAATGVDPWSIDGTADMRLTTHTLLLAAA